MNIESELQKRIKTQLGDKDYRTLKLSYGFCLKFAEDMVLRTIKEFVCELGFDVSVVDNQIDAKEVHRVKLKEYAKERGIDLTGGGL